MIINILKALSDINRLRILNLLRKEALCVCEFEYLLDINQSNLSRHLRYMNKLGLLESWRENKFVYYKINEIFVKKNPFIQDILDRLDEEEQMCIDTQNYEKYKKDNIPCSCVTTKIFEKRIKSEAK